MENYGLLLKKIREAQRLSIRDAAKKLGKSAGWISEVENGRGNSKLSKAQFNETVGLYGGWKYKSRFGIWITHTKKYSGLENKTMEGPVYNFMRHRKGLSQKEAARLSGISPSYLCMIENGRDIPVGEVRSSLLKLYGQTDKNFRKYITDSKKSQRIPVRYRLSVLLNTLKSDELQKVLDFVSSITNEGGSYA